MMDTRFSLALEAGHVALPEAGDIVVFGAVGQMLTGLPRERLKLVCDDVIAAESYKAQGYDVMTEPPESGALGVVFVPRGRIEGRVMFARAAALSGGKLIVDGAKTDGIDSHFRRTFDTREDFLFFQGNTELIIDFENFRIDLIQRVQLFLLHGRGIIIHVLEVDFWIINHGPIRLFEFQPTAIGF